MKMNTVKSFLMLSAAMALAASGRAFWLGNPGPMLGEASPSMEAMFDWGTRDIKAPAGGVGDLDFFRLYAQYTKPFMDGEALQFFVRGMPLTGRLDLEGSSFDPPLYGFGAGFRWTPAHEFGPVRLGFQASADWMNGSEEQGGFNNEVRWTEFSFSGGASYEISSAAAFYGGLSIIPANIDLDVGQIQTDLEEDELVGGFLGLDFLPWENWTFGAELHFLNEQTVSVKTGYKF
jgi:hypothetical protein